MTPDQIARIREQIELGFSDDDIAAVQEDERIETLAAADDEYYAHGSRDDIVYAISEYGPVNDAGEPGWM